MNTLSITVSVSDGKFTFQSWVKDENSQTVSLEFYCVLATDVKIKQVYNDTTYMKIGGFDYVVPTEYASITWNSSEQINAVQVGERIAILLGYEF
jgi:hypothetical protein